MRDGRYGLGGGGIQIWGTSAAGRGERAFRRRRGRRRRSRRSADLHRFLPLLSLSILISISLYSVLFSPWDISPLSLYSLRICLSLCLYIYLDLSISLSCPSLDDDQRPTTNDRRLIIDETHDDFMRPDICLLWKMRNSEA